MAKRLKKTDGNKFNSHVSRVLEALRQQDIDRHEALNRIRAYVDHLLLVEDFDEAEEIETDDKEKEKILNDWVKKKKQDEREKGMKVFHDIPERWLDDPLYGCINGHLRRVVMLGQKGGNICVTCRARARMIPPETTALEFTAAVASYLSDGREGRREEAE